eukprot:9228163-Alexandrium_andersonii.AAC.1
MAMGPPHLDRGDLLFVEAYPMCAVHVWRRMAARSHGPSGARPKTLTGDTWRRGKYGRNCPAC